MLTSVAALAEASRASAADRYLSVLPNSLLLEQIAGTYLPLSVGAAIHLPAVMAASPGGQLTIAAEQARATAMVLVPELLAAWVKELQARGKPGPDFLRFIAVGGAPVRHAWLRQRGRQGLPVYEGYGLSECCSVVSVNRPDARRAGTVGRPLSDVHVAIDEGEIAVRGPTVMRGYVGEPQISGLWHTGDLGHFDPDGFLIVTGRKDNVIVTAAGRNINPEWVEDVIAADNRVGRCVVVAYERELVALIIPAIRQFAATPRQCTTSSRPPLANCRIMPNRVGIWRCPIRNSTALVYSPPMLGRDVPKSARSWLSAAGRCRFKMLREYVRLSRIVPANGVGSAIIHRAAADSGCPAEWGIERIISGFSRSSLSPRQVYRCADGARCRALRP